LIRKPPNSNVLSIVKLPEQALAHIHNHIKGELIMALRIILLALCLYSCFAGAQNEIKVWAVDSGSRKIYHCPRSKWYGTGTGREISECEAIREGYRPVIGDGCGSACRRP